MKNLRSVFYELTDIKKIQASEAQNFFEKEIFASKFDWQQFFRWAFLACGIGFLGVGIVFFFAYNWDALHKFVKLGLIGSLLVFSIILYFLPKFSEQIKQLIIKVSCLLIGVLFAVFGQIYQTGANAFDFFLAWSIFAFLWVLISNFLPLWLLYFFLVNTTLYFLFKQVNLPVEDFVFFTFVVFLNSLPLLVSYIRIKYTKKELTYWFLAPITIANTVFISVIIGFIIIDSFNDFPYSWLAFIFGICYLAFQFFYAFQVKQVSYIALAAISVVALFCMKIIVFIDSEESILIIGIIILVSASILIKTLINLNKKWHHETGV